MSSTSLFRAGAAIQLRSILCDEVTHHVHQKARRHRTTFLLAALCGIAPFIIATSLPADEEKSVDSQSHFESLVTRKDLSRVLKMPAPELQVIEGADLKSTLAHFAKAMSEALGKSVSIQPEYAELELEGLSSLDEVKLKELQLPAGTYTFANQLNYVFEQTVDPELTFTVSDDRFDVTTLAKAMDTIFTRVYAIDRLLMAQDRVSEDQSGLLARDRGARSLKSAIEATLSMTQHLSPNETVILHGQYLILTTNPAGHDRVKNLLESLAAAIEENGELIVIDSPMTGSEVDSTQPTIRTPYVGGGLQ